MSNCFIYSFAKLIIRKIRKQFVVMLSYYMIVCIYQNVANCVLYVNVDILYLKSKERIK